MNRKLIATLASLLALAASAAIALVAQAAAPPQWLSDGKPIGVKHVTVKTSGKLTFDLTQFGVKITCKVADKDIIANPAGGPGTDEMKTFKLSGCKPGKGETNICAPATLEIIAVGLPWMTHLELVPPNPGVRNLIEDMALEFRCSKGGAIFGTIAASPFPKVGNSVLEFEGLAPFEGPFGSVYVTGNDNLKGPKGDVTITAAP